MFLFSECKCPSYNWRRLEDPPWSLLMGPLWLLGVKAQPYSPLSPRHHHSLPQPASNVTLWSAWPSLLLHNTTPLPLLLKIRFGEGKLWRTRCATPEKGSGPHRSSPWCKQERRIVSDNFVPVVDSYRMKPNLQNASSQIHGDSFTQHWVPSGRRTPKPGSFNARLNQWTSERCVTLLRSILL